jgi:hypothetical protein
MTGMHQATWLLLAIALAVMVLIAARGSRQR